MFAPYFLLVTPPVWPGAERKGDNNKKSNREKKDHNCMLQLAKCYVSYSHPSIHHAKIQPRRNMMDWSRVLVLFGAGRRQLDDVFVHDLGTARHRQCSIMHAAAVGIRSCEALVAARMEITSGLGQRIQTAVFPSGVRPDKTRTGKTQHLDVHRHRDKPHRRKEIVITK